MYGIIMTDSSTLRALLLLEETNETSTEVFHRGEYCRTGNHVFQGRGRLCHEPDAHPLAMRPSWTARKLRWKHHRRCHAWPAVLHRNRGCGAGGLRHQAAGRRMQDTFPLRERVAASRLQKPPGSVGRFLFIHSSSLTIQ